MSNPVSKAVSYVDLTLERDSTRECAAAAAAGTLIAVASEAMWLSSS